MPTAAPPTDRRHPPPPRDDAAEAWLERWDKAMTLPIVVSAIVPLVLAPSDDGGVVVAVVALGSWLVFLSDLVVRVWCLPGYLRTWPGRFDLFIVVVTFPWALVGLGSARFVGLFRLLRLSRLVVAGKRLRRFAQLMNRVVIVAAGMLALCSYIVMKAEGPENGFGSYADALWWGIVTLTTVGYGDLVPQTSTGQLTAAVLMVTGIALLGALAGTLADALHLDPDDDDGGGGGDDDAGAATPGARSAGDDEVVARLDRIEAQLDALVRQLASDDPG